MRRPNRSSSLAWPALAASLGISLGAARQPVAYDLVILHGRVKIAGRPHEELPLVPLGVGVLRGVERSSVRVVAHLREHGYEPHEERFEDNETRAAYVTDPDGNVVELWTWGGEDR